MDAKLRRPRAAISPRSALLWFTGIAGAVALVLAAVAGTSGFFDRNAVHLAGMDAGGAHPLVVVYFSGDMGLRVGMATHVIPALVAANLPVYGISSPTVFATRKSRADVDALVASSIRKALARSGADRAVLIGQSFGADILAAGVTALPPGLRAKVAAMILVVPGTTTYFQADPTGLHYFGAPDANVVTAIRAIDWAPVTCIYGEDETDSLCPALAGTGAAVMELPGGHMLNHDHDRLIAATFTALGPILRQNEEQRK